MIPQYTRRILKGKKGDCEKYRQHNKGACFCEQWDISKRAGKLTIGSFRANMGVAIDATSVLYFNIHPCKSLFRLEILRRIAG